MSDGSKTQIYRGLGRRKGIGRICGREDGQRTRQDGTLSSESMFMHANVLKSDLMRALSSLPSALSLFCTRSRVSNRK